METGEAWPTLEVTWKQKRKKGICEYNFAMRAANKVQI